MRLTGRRADSARTGIRGAVLVILALFSLLLVPALASAIPAPLQPAAAAPVNTVAPTLTGAPTLGQTLTCSQGAWANNPTSFSYAWLRSGVPIAGQSASKYVVQAADAGHTISCQVTAGNGGGDYTVSGLESGSYKVSFYPSGEGVNYVRQFYSGKSTSAAATPVPVTAPNQTGGVNAELQAGGQITGQVTSAVSHAPIANILVCSEEAITHEFGNCGLSNSNGEYTVSGLPSGLYVVEFSAIFSEENYPTQYYSSKTSNGEANQVSVTAGATTGSINAELGSGSQSGQISGIVTKASGGAPIEGIQVCASQTNGGGSFACQTTNASGEYTISGLSEGRFEVSFSSNGCAGSCANYIDQYYNNQPSIGTAEEVEVTAGKVTTGIGAKLVEGGQIIGRVTSASGGAPLANVDVCADSGGTGDCAVTDANGEYTVKALTTGEYTVTFSPFSGNYLPRYYNEQSSLVAAEHVAVKAGETAGPIDAKLVEGGQITGRVTDAATHGPLEKVEVCAGETSESIYGCATTNANGEYVISGLTTGTYALSFNDETESANYLGQSVAGVTVSAGGVTGGVNAELHSGGQILGFVADASTHAGLTKIEVCAERIGGGTYRCANTIAGAPSVSAASNVLTVPSGDFTQTKKAVFDAKKGELDFFFKFPTAGKLSWGLFFRNSDVGFADSLGLSLGAREGRLAETARKSRSKKCKAGYIKHGRRCVRLLVPFAAGSQGVSAGAVEVKVRVGSKAIKALKAGRTLHVGGRFTFQSALGGKAVSKAVSVIVRMPKKHAKKHGKGKRR